MAKRVMSRNDQMEMMLFEQEVSSQMRKHKRALKRSRNIEEREMHTPHHRRQSFDDIDEQYEAYLRYGELGA